MQHNYRFPLKCGELVKKGEAHPKSSLADSVQAHLSVLMVTRYGEHRFDPAYGCEIWEYDFDNPAVLEQSKHELEEKIRESILKYETRLSDLNVTVSVDQAEFVSPAYSKVKRVKKKIEVRIKGIIRETNKEFTPPPFVIFFSPISVK